MTARFEQRLSRLEQRATGVARMCDSSSLTTRCRSSLRLTLIWQEPRICSTPSGVCRPLR